MIQNKLIILLISLGYGVMSAHPSLALPPPSDIPEEILRTDIIVEGRSSLNNEALTPEETELLRQELAESKFPPQLNPKVRQLIFLLQIRRALRTVIPFL